MHLSKSVYDSILMEFCFAGTKLQEMRYFIRSIYSLHEEEARRYQAKRPYLQDPQPRSQTLEALVEAVDIYIRDIEVWCANKEEDILRAKKGVGGPLVVTLLGCCHEMKEKMTSALGIIQEVLLDVVKQEINRNDATHHRTDVAKVGFLRAKAFASIPPYIIAKRILDSLILSIKTQLAIGELATASKLSDVFVHAAAPVWNGIGEWLRDGMTIGIGENMDLDDPQGRSQNEELFIEKRDIEFVDPNFWEQGYTLRREGENDWEEGEPTNLNEVSSLVPNIFLELGDDILGAGKAVGLLRALGIDPYSGATDNSLQTWQWEAFIGILVAATETSNLPEPRSTGFDEEDAAPDKTYTMRLTIENMQTIMEDRVMKRCQAAHSTLNRLLFEECSLQEHLFSLENMCFMRRGDAMTTFCDNIFMKVSIFVDECVPATYGVSLCS
jgi:gamma-tubulin complex component 5